MRAKKYFLFFFFITSINILANTTKLDSEELTIDLNNNKISSETGAVVNNGNLKGLFYEIERNPEDDKIKFSEEAVVKIEQNDGDVKIESKRGEVSKTEKKGEFFDNFAYVNVAKSTGAEAPNDKIYFGSPYIKYEDEKFYIKNGWLTTDFNIVNYQNNPEKAGYHLKTEDTLIEPEKQITFKNINLFLKDKDVMPFNFPWFRINIRKNSRVPLFPTFTFGKDAEFETMWGFLYGNKNDKFVGGFAPKYSAKKGLFIGRWENWYNFEKIGQTRLDIDDLLIVSNAKKPTKNSDLSEYEKNKKSYRVTLSHDYKGENGNFNLNVVNSTRSLDKDLADVMDTFENNNLYKTLNIKRYEYDKNIGYYNLNTNLKNLGENKDIQISSDVNLVSDKKAYSLLVYDKIRDTGTDYRTDHDLYSRVSVLKDNEKVKFYGKYNYLYDMDPGSISGDLKSRDEKIDLGFLHKESNFSIDYSKRNGDDFRPLQFWERDVKSSLKHKNILGIDMNYNPATVSKYKENNFEKVSVALGKYNVKNFIISPSLKYDYSKKVLDLTKDEYRKNILGDFSFSEYNRFENEIYRENLEKRVDLKVEKEDNYLNFAYGNIKSEIRDRSGLFDGSFRKFENESDFYEIAVGKNEIKLGEKSNLSLDGKFRQDNYKNSSDKTNDINLKVKNDLNLYENNDVKLGNNLEVEYQKYDFSGNSKNEEERLAGKSNYTRIKNVLDYSDENKDIKYTFGYKLSENPFAKKLKNGEQFFNKLDFRYNEKTQFGVNYSNTKRFTDKTIDSSNHNDLTFENYGFDLRYGKENFSFSNTNLKYDVSKFNTPFDLYEKVSEQVYSYSHDFEDSKIDFTYAYGKDKAKVSDGRNLDRENKKFSVGYRTGLTSDIEHDFYAAYKQYRYGRNSVDNDIKNTDVYNLSYEYKDKRIEEEQILKYANLEYADKKSEIDEEDIQNIKDLIEKRQNFRQKYGLENISDETFKIGNYKKTLNTYVTLEKNNRRYSQTGDLKDSLSKFEGGINLSYNRFGLSYKFKEEADWKKKSGTYEWSRKNREHEIATYAKFGKISESWKVKTYAKLYDNLADEASSKANRKKSIDGIGVEIGKEMGYYEWAVSYENKYSPSTKDYEWRAGVHFTLLTFPKDSIFGFGARSRGENTRPDGYLFGRPSPLND